MNKQKIRITADSTCDLSPELIRQYNVETVPLYIVMDGKSYRDGVDITPDELYAKVDELGRIGNTAAINIDDYLAFFRRLRKDCDAVIHFCISSEMSSCVQNARIAGEAVGNVYVIDSRNLSTAIGLLVLAAVDMVNRGMTVEEILPQIEALIPRLDVTFVTTKLEYLRMGGRCSAVAVLGANLLHIRPCIQVRGGVMGVGKKYTGSMENVLTKYIRDRIGDGSKFDLGRMFITHSGVDDSAVELVRKTVLECAPFRQIYITRAGCTISNHCGPGTLGVLLVRKEPI